MTQEELAALFMPLTIERMQSVKSGGRLVHYTSAEAAYHIITSQTIRLRNALVMNDYSEIEHGLSCIRAAWSGAGGIKLQKWFDETRPGLREKFTQIFDSHWNTIRFQSYILSLSEHGDDEDFIGRLSMWRAYGRSAGVALVLNNTAFLSETQELGVFSTPVIYMDQENFLLWFDKWVDNLIAHTDKISAMSADETVDTLFLVFRIFALALKHPGFVEEREWRVFHSPGIDSPSKWLTKLLAVVNGFPQELYTVSLVDDPEIGVVGLAAAGLVNRVIIGPCEHPIPVRDALVTCLGDVGVPASENKVWISNIPLRNG